MSIIQSSRITDLETALLAATDLAKRQCKRIEELEAERDARPVVSWRWLGQEREKCVVGPVRVGNIEKSDSGWRATLRGWLQHTQVVGEDFPTPEAAKAAVEEALRGLSAKTEGM